MNFLAVLKSGASAQNVANEFVQVLLQKSWQLKELCLELACDFVNDILRIIGLNCTITPEQINEKWSYVWPMEQIQIYNFHYVEADFKEFEEFLESVCTLVIEQHEIFIKDKKEFWNDDDYESPVEFLMQLVAVWCSTYKQLLKLEEMQKNKRFEEPLARINLHLLVGMHKIRKIYRLDLQLLDAICNRLYWSALQGLYYPQTHDMTFKILLKMFSKDYVLFYEFSAPTINFFYEAFIVETNNLTPLKVYQSLQKMLKQKVTDYKLNILLNFLIEPYMLRVYFSTLVAKKYRWYNKITIRNIEKIQEEAIKFLNILQSHLLSLDCFSREFMEALLNFVFKRDSSLPPLACTLYITIMKRRFSDEEILKHLMDFYVAHVGSITHLKPYVQAMYESFAFLINFNHLLDIIADHQTSDIIRLLSAHILVIIFELKFRKRSSLEIIFKRLPEIFEILNCQKTEGILLKVYSYIPISEIQKPFIDHFLHYAVCVFTCVDSSLEYPLLMNIFIIFHKGLDFYKKWEHLELISDHILIKYYEMIRDLKKIEDNRQKPLNRQSLEHYNGLIKRFNIILKTKYNLLDHIYVEVIRSFPKFFLYNVEIKNLILEDKSLIDLYVLEIVVSCISKLFKLEGDNQIYGILPDTEELFQYLWLILNDMQKLLKFPIVRIKTYFCCFLQLIIKFPLKLDVQVYQQLVNILIVVNFKNKLVYNKEAKELQQIHPAQSVEYQRLMLRQFAQIHKYQTLRIGTNTVWKLCIYYGRSKNTFHEELRVLLTTLANYRLNIYNHIISVLIYNLYKQEPALKHSTILSIIKKHKYLIDNDIKANSSQLLKVHVVLQLLQILVKALKVQRMKAGCNRLEALSHLYILIEGLDLNQLQAKQSLLEQLDKLQQNLLGAEECRSLSDFKDLLNKQISKLSVYT